jgi:integrase
VRLRQHEHQRPTLVLLASWWKPQKHKNGSICKTAADASKPEAFLAGVEIAKPLQQAGRFRIPFRKTAGHQAVRPSFSPEKENTASFRRIGITGVGWHTFRHSVGTMLAEMGEHQLTIRDYLRHSNLHVTNKYLQATSKTKRLAQDKLVDAILPTGILPKTNLIQ